MVINVIAGYAADGKRGCGAIGLIKESTEARLVKDKLITLLRDNGHTVYDCTVDDGLSSSDILRKAVSKCNAHDVDINVLICFNSGAGDKTGDGITTGTEVLVYSDSSKVMDEAVMVADKVSKRIAVKNRGVKVDNGSYILKKTKAPALMVRCLFVDDSDDVKRYNSDKIASAIATGILNESIKTVSTDTPTSGDIKTVPFLVKVKVNNLPIREVACEVINIIEGHNW